MTAVQGSARRDALEAKRDDRPARRTRGCSARRIIAFAITFAVGLGVLTTSPTAHAAETDDLAELSLEALLDVEVTSVSKRSQSMFDAAAAITVISNEEIRRSGMTTVPELLRLVPGIQVARITSNRWAISSRGLNEEFTAGLLVLLDGRSLYTHFFGGAYWDIQDYPLEDIDRIEVIRGPGGTVWGENAVNGVINIITKNAAETQGVLVSGYGGTQEVGKTIRYGGQIGDHTAYRVFGRGFRQADYDTNRERRAHDDWIQFRGGARIDSQPTEQDALRLSGEFYDQNSENNASAGFPGTFVDTDVDARGGHLLASWRHTFEDDASFFLQAYYDHTERDSSLTGQEVRRTADVEFQHDFGLFSRVDMSWGGNFRFSGSHYSPIATAPIDPNRSNFYLGNAFLQGTSRFFDDRLAVTLGTKVGLNSWSGFEYQPSFRFLAKPVEDHAIWGAVSRAVQLPTQAERDVRTNIGFLTLLGSNDVRSVDLTSFELGYRFRITPRMTAELALYYNLYENTRQFFANGATATFVTRGEVQTRGGELQLKAAITDWWRVTAGYAYFDVDEDVPAGLIRFTQASGANPDHQVTLHQSFDLLDIVTFDAMLFYVDGLSSTIPAGQPDNVENYVRLDLRLAYAPFDGVELSVTGQNLTERRHYEFSDVQQAQASQVPRSVHGQVRIEF